jgi:hypothetical protein
MSVYAQLNQIMGENFVEVSGIREVCGVYLENKDVNISVECLEDKKRLKLSFQPLNSKNFMPFSFVIPITNQRILLSCLTDGGKVIIMPEDITDNLCDIEAIKEVLQKTGGVWLDGLPAKTVKEIINYCIY